MFGGPSTEKVCNQAPPIGCCVNCARIAVQVSFYAEIIMGSPPEDLDSSGPSYDHSNSAAMRADSDSTFVSSYVSVMASAGQTSAHLPHPRHSF